MAKINKDFSRDRLSNYFVYESYDSHSGLFFNRGSIGFVLISNPLPGAEVSAQGEVADFIANSENLPDGSSLQTLLIGSNDVSFLLNRWEKERKGKGKIYEELAKKRCEFLTRKANDGLVKDSHLLISLTVPDTDTCRLGMERRKSSLVSTLESIGLFTKSLDDVHLISILQKIWGRDNYGAAEINPYEVLSEQILPVDFSLYEDDNLVSLKEDEAFICLEPQKRPLNWSLGLMDLFIGNENRKGEYIATDYLIHVGIHVLSNQSSQSTAAIAKREAIEKNISSGMGKFFPDLLDEAEDMRLAVSSIQAGDRMVHIHTNVILKGKKTKVEEYAKIYASIMRRNGWGFVPVKYDHLATMLSVMPMSMVEEEKSFFAKKIGGIAVALEKIGRGFKTISSESKALLSIIGEYKGNLNAPGLLLTGRRGQLKYYSQFGNGFLPHLSSGATGGDSNPNMVIAGVSGSGKSVVMQDIMLSILGIGGKVFVLDYGKSFVNLCKRLGGNYIEFNPSMPVSINPFSEVPLGDDRVSTEARSDFLASFPITLSTMAAPKDGTNDLQQTILSRALRESFELKKNKTQIDDIANWLFAQKDQVSQELGKMLFNYTSKGSYGGFFKGSAELTFNSNIVVIETDYLRNYPDLMAVIVQIMMTHINHTMAKGKTNKPSGIFIDEMKKTLKDPKTLKFIDEISRIVRKYNACTVVATQLVTDFHNLGADAMSIFEGASHKIIFKQTADTLNKMRSMALFKSYVDSDMRFKRLLSVESKKGKYGEFSIWSEGVSGDICRLRIDPFSLLLMSTDPTDKQLMKDYQASGLSISESINRILDERGQI